MPIWRSDPGSMYTVSDLYTASTGTDLYMGSWWDQTTAVTCPTNRPYYYWRTSYNSTGEYPAIYQRNVFQPSCPNIITRRQDWTSTMLERQVQALEARQGNLARHAEQARAQLQNQQDLETERRLREHVTHIQHEQREREAEAAEARKVARELLLSHLAPEQRDTFERNNWFVVEGEKGQQYRIRGDTLIANVDHLRKDGTISHRLCAHAHYQYPMGDQLLTQKLLIEADEQAFLRIANVHGA